MRSSPSSSAKAPSERLGSSHCGTSRLRDFHFIELCPADTPVWLNASRERLLRAPRPLRLRLRCQQGNRCRSGLQMYCLSASTSMLLDLTGNGIPLRAGLHSQLLESLELICLPMTCMRRRRSIWLVRRYACSMDQKSRISRKTSISYAIPSVRLCLPRICSRIAGKMWNSFRAMQGWKQSRCFTSEESLNICAIMMNNGFFYVNLLSF